MQPAESGVHSRRHRGVGSHDQWHRHRDRKGQRNRDGDGDRHGPRFADNDADYERGALAVGSWADDTVGVHQLQLGERPTDNSPADLSGHGSTVDYGAGATFTLP